jgi:signal transduction histidine kinase
VCPARIARHNSTPGCAGVRRCDITDKVGRGLQLASARVIALGRLIMAGLFLFAIWLDVTQPAKAPAATFTLLIGYVVFAAAMAVATWRNWWFDAQSAGPAHAIDIAFFAVIVFLTEGYTSPYFIFFIFLLLAAAIRWGWRETTLTAILVTLMFLISGLLATKTGRGPFELYRFVIRTTDLVIMSLILIWFGINKWGARPGSSIERALSEEAGSDPLEAGVRAAMTTLHARTGSAMWQSDSAEKVSGFTVSDGQISFADFDPSALTHIPKGPVLYDLPRMHGLTRDGKLGIAATSELASAQVQSTFALSEGLAIPLQTAAGEGLLYFQGVAALSTDHIEIAEQIADAIASHIQRHALLESAEESAAARSRLALARDLHDSVVQFLAGAAFRLEAMRRAHASRRNIEPELDELKKLLLQEQIELRSFITALRSGSQVTLRDLVRDLQSLADRLSRQWTVRCKLSANASDVHIPAKLHLDAHQLVREAVANAVRHAGAKSIKIAVAAGVNELRIDFVNDGLSYPSDGGRVQMPRSLQERIDQAGGAIELSRGMDVTKISISLPLSGNSP